MGRKHINTQKKQAVYTFFFYTGHQLFRKAACGLLEPQTFLSASALVLKIRSGACSQSEFPYCHHVLCFVAWDKPGSCELSSHTKLSWKKGSRSAFSALQSQIGIQCIRQGDSWSVWSTVLTKVRHSLHDC